VFGLGRRLGSPLVGLVAWAVWITAPAELYLRPSYMSQVSSTLAWLLAWIALVRWRDHGRPGSLVGFAVAAAVGAIVRPVTAFALLLPPGIWILIRAWQTRRLRQVAFAIAAALPIIALVPWWSVATSGRAFPTPYSEYSRVYAPWNFPGFTVDTTPPLRAETPAMRKFREEWLPLHRAHRLDRLPSILGERLAGIAVTFFGEHGWRWLLLGAFVAGLFVAPPELRLALTAGALLVLLYLWMAARWLWTVYYLEAYPALALVTAVGAAWLVRRTAQAAVRRRPGLDPAVLTGAALLVGLVVAVPGTVDRLIQAREQQVDLRLVQTDLDRAIESIPGKAVIFVGTGPEHRPYESYTRNFIDPGRARVWVVLDRGADDRRLMDLAPDRRPYRFDPGSGRLSAWGSQGK